MTHHFAPKFINFCLKKAQFYLNFYYKRLLFVGQDITRNGKMLQWGLTITSKKEKLS